VSELMLQQTRVDVVIPYFERWTALWPDFASLAAASQEEVLAAWSGLGYYRRARALHDVACAVVEDHGGRLPEEPDELRKLPGIGPYTAAAIASIAFDRPFAVVDGNVVRVLCRLLGVGDDPGAARDALVREAAQRLVGGLVGKDPAAAVPPEGLRPGDMNQALMELGAVVCTPVGPDCPHCPVARSCIAHRAGLTDEIPRRRERRTPVDVVLRAAVVRRGEEFLLVRRPEGALLSGLWEVPTTSDGGTRNDLARLVRDAIGRRVRLPDEPARTFRHTITHRRITVEVYEARIPEDADVADGDGVAWIRRVDLRDFGASSMTKKALAEEEPSAKRQRRSDGGS